MKLKEYQTYLNVQTITFENDSNYQVEFTIDDDGTITLEAQSISLAEIKECIEMIESGKLEITL